MTLKEPTSRAAIDAGQIRVAIVHDYLTQRGGAERVALALTRAFPGAPIFTTLFEPDHTYPQFRDQDVRTTWLQRVRPFRRRHHMALPLFAPTMRSLDIDEFDVVIASSSGWAHGARTAAPILVYCYNPARWLYQREDYVKGIGRLQQVGLDLLRRPLIRWDRRAARRASVYVTTSTAVQERIRKTYGIEASIVPPPVGFSDGKLDDLEPVAGVESGYLLTVGRARGYKHTAEVVEAMALLPEERLVVLGGESELAGGSIVAVRDLSDAQVRWLYANAKALISVSHEDFGLTPLESNLFGTPAIVLAAGGFLDTVIEGKNGRFVDSPTPEAIADGVARLNDAEWDRSVIKAHGELYSEDRFRSSLLDLIRPMVQRHSSAPITLPK